MPIVPWYIRIMPYLGALSAVLGAVWFIHHDGYRKAEIAAEARNAALEKAVRADLRQTEARLAGTLHAIDQRRADQIAALDTLHETRILPTIQKELTREVRFTDPGAGLSDGLRASLNAALASVACTARTDGGIDCALPAAAPDPGQ